MYAIKDDFGGCCVRAATSLETINYIRHERIEQGGGYRLGFGAAADVGANPLYLLLLLPSAHLLPRHHVPVDDSRRGQRERRPRVDP